MKKRISRRTRVVSGIVAGAAAVLVGVGVLPASAGAQRAPLDTGSSRSSAAAQALPGGKANFVVSVGSFKAGSTTNWERLGYYVFHPSNGTVTGKWWRWNQTNKRDIRVDTPVLASGCGATQCYTQTMKRFLTGATETVTGKYALNGTALVVAWPSGDRYVQEKWTVTRVQKAGGSTDGSLVQLVWGGVGRGYSATTGYAFGSNASLSTNASAATLMQSANRVKYAYRFNGIVAGKLSGGPSAYDLRIFRQCKDGRCLGAAGKSKPGKGCVAYPPGDTPTSATVNYYLAHFGGDRRDATEHWFRCLAWNAKTHKQSCYQLNSHVKPSLQVIDDSGRFRGWVGAETSFMTKAANQSTGPAIDDTLAIFKIGPRVLS
ncbi:hypothetical protein Athai_16760 [Actinocatenispora thailandica]|uniref:Uncharacterized protein n=1 Tax=Actinocatenispora thailandica TaxID=227318 RepID=A0A7R7HVU0_9ACTN|nr:hypothetical protein [Actinocatenispora thailandica]BCJ34173.1 hypothetical protein Athai_16760 [Actinocatenispora thailandica]